jgi:peptidoglycan/LPS O-acetylase OafA/YrhL
MARTLGALCHGRENNLNLIRMVAATAVLVSHAWPIALGAGTVQPLEARLGTAMGSLAVMVFFAISGVLVARSFARQPSVRTWCLARVLRLFPALAVMLVLTVAVLGPVATTLPLAAYAGHAETWSYVPNNLTLALRQGSLPGVFEALPRPNETNGSLWTLYYEVICYGGVLAMGLAGAFRSWRMLAGAACIFVALNVAVLALPRDAVPTTLVIALSLGLPFAIGVGFYVARDRLPLSPWLLLPLVGGAWLVRGTPLWDPALALALAYGTFLLAYLPGGAIRHYNRLGDYSYGLYIYAWPVQQATVLFLGPMGPLGNVLLALPVTLALAWASWTLVEKPALRLVPHSDPRPDVTGDAPERAVQGAYSPR